MRVFLVLDLCCESEWIDVGTHQWRERVAYMSSVGSLGLKLPQQSIESGVEHAGGDVCGYLCDAGL